MLTAIQRSVVRDGEDMGLQLTSQIDEGVGEEGNFD
jgi:hypothetical protein